MSKANVVLFCESHIPAIDAHVEQFIGQHDVTILAKDEQNKHGLNWYYEKLSKSDMTIFYFYNTGSQWLSYYIGMANAIGKPKYIIGSKKPVIPDVHYHGSNVYANIENESKYLLSREYFYELRDVFDSIDIYSKEHIKIEQFFGTHDIRYRKTYGKDRKVAEYEATIKSRYFCTPIRYEYSWKLNKDQYDEEYAKFRNLVKEDLSYYNNTIKKIRYSYKINDYIVSFDEIILASYNIFIVEVETNNQRLYPDLGQVMSLAGPVTEDFKKTLNMTNHKNVTDWNASSNKYLCKVNMRSSIEVDTLKTLLNEMVSDSMVKKG